MLATELIRPSLRVRVNEIQPGYFASASQQLDRADRTGEMTTAGGKISDERGVSSVSEQQISDWDIPVGRVRRSDLRALTVQVGTPSEIAQVTLLLATNRYMTGSAISIDGGWLTTHA